MSIYASLPHLTPLDCDFDLRFMLILMLRGAIGATTTLLACLTVVASRWMLFVASQTIAWMCIFAVFWGCVFDCDDQTSLDCEASLLRVIIQIPALNWPLYSCASCTYLTVNLRRMSNQCATFFVSPSYPGDCDDLLGWKAKKIWCAANFGRVIYFFAAVFVLSASLPLLFVSKSGTRKLAGRTLCCAAFFLLVFSSPAARQSDW